MILMRMVWTALLLVLVALFGLLFYIRSENSRAYQANASLQPVIRSVVVKMLDGREDMVVANLVIGSEVEPGRHDFRGATRTGSVSVPIYGVVELTCPQISTDPQCWNLVVLERDGKAWPLEAPSVIEPVNEMAPASDVDGSASDTYVGEDETLAGGSDAASEMVEPDAASVIPQSDEVEAGRVFAVTSDQVNGRAGPGTNYEIVTSITLQQRLILLEAGAEWGLFRLQAAVDGDNSEFWVWLGLVKPAAEGP